MSAASVQRIALIGLAVATLAGTFASAAPPTGLSAIHRDGQTFLTWKEVSGAGTRYRIYRSPTTIAAPGDLTAATRLGEVGQESGVDVRERLLDLGIVTRRYVIVPGGSSLPVGTGLFVATTKTAGAWYYAVTSIVGGVEDTTLVTSAGGNSLGTPVVEATGFPKPVRQRAELGGGSVYTSWSWAEDIPCCLATGHRHSLPYNLRLFGESRPGPRPARIDLHGRTSSSRWGPALLPDVPDMLQVTPDDWVQDHPADEFYKHQFWLGFNHKYGTGEDLESGALRDTKSQWVRYLREWVIRDFSVDADRVALSGISMGGIGTQVIGLSYPGDFSGLSMRVPLLGPEGIVPGDPAEGPSELTLIWGNGLVGTNDGVLIGDRFLTYKRLVRTGRDHDAPPMSIVSGRSDDIVPWYDKPPFYARFRETALHGVFLWDTSGHEAGSGIWRGVHDKWLRFFMAQSRRAAYPAMTRLSLDDDPGNGDPADGDPVGCINCYATWDPALTVDTVDALTFVVKLVDAPGQLDDAPAETATVSITPRRMRAFITEPGIAFTLENRDAAGGALLQSVVSVSDADGFVTFDDVEITKAGNRLQILPANGAGDRDADGLVADNCPDTPNPDQRDTDGDAWGDACDQDDDDDGAGDLDDALPLDRARGRRSVPELAFVHPYDAPGRLYLNWVEDRADPGYHVARTSLSSKGQAWICVADDVRSNALLLSDDIPPAGEGYGYLVRPADVGTGEPGHFGQDSTGAIRPLDVCR